ncbi:MAG TPA: hypothetical protein VI462_01780 [Acidimicrobiia bacterium]
MELEVISHRRPHDPRVTPVEEALDGEEQHDGTGQREQQHVGLRRLQRPRDSALPGGGSGKIWAGGAGAGAGVNAAGGGPPPSETPPRVRPALTAVAVRLGAVVGVVVAGAPERMDTAGATVDVVVDVGGDCEPCGGVVDPPALCGCCCL